MDRHFYGFAAWSMPKRGRAYCGRTVAGSRLVGTMADTTCPHCRAIHEANEKAYSAIKAEQDAGRVLDMRPEALAIVAHSNAVYSANYQYKAR